MTAPEPYRVAFYFDYGSGCCLWSENDRARQRFDYSVDHDDLPLPPATIAILDELCERVDRSLNWDYPPDPSPWRQAECDRFNADVAAVIARVRRELGAEWEVSDCFLPLSEDPDLDRYNADPKGFRRESSGSPSGWRTWGRKSAHPRRRLTFRRHTD